MILLVVLSVVSSSIQAVGLANQFEIEFVRVDRTGKGYVQFKQELVGEPASCASTYPKALAFDVNTAGGNAILSAALTAKASNAKVYAKGTGQCTIYGVMEMWDWGYIK